MDFTRNEKKVLIMLLENARTSDISIAEKLKISSQAVGKIRKKLESNVINSYSLNLDYAKMGLQAFAMSLSRITSKGHDEGELEIEQKLLKEPNIINVYRLPSGSYTHIIFYGFKDISDMENFFHSVKKKEEIHKFINNKELFTFSHNSLIKNNSLLLFQKIISDIDCRSNTGKLKDI